MADFIEREILENAKKYNRGFNVGYEAGKKHQKEVDDKEKEDWMRCK